MKPFWLFLYVLFILIGFFVVSFFMPKETPPGELIPEPGPDSIQSSTLQLAVDTTEVLIQDSLKVVAIVEKDELTGLQFPSGDSTVLYPFFQKLKHLDEFRSPLRIMYLGDSQLEGDRITSTMRSKFQEGFGGAGIGLIAPDLLYNLSHSFTVERSGEFRLISFPDFTDSLQNSSLVFKEAVLPANQEGWFKIKQIRNKESRTDYLQLKMFYRSSGDFGVVVKEGGNIIYRGRVTASSVIQALNFNFSFTPSSVELFFQSTDSLTITGFSLETKAGIQVDNIALRGLSFPPFSLSETKSMEETIRLMNPGLTILHFGVNIAPSVREKYSNYRSRLVREIRKMEKIMPDVPVLIVGISDMARKVNGEMVSYPNIEAIKKAQKEAAETCGCAFWDLEEFMGGAGSMIKWANADPRLGQKDFVHFTNEGTEKIGNQLYELIIDEYKNYLKIQPEE